MSTPSLRGKQGWARRNSPLPLKREGDSRSMKPFNWHWRRINPMGIIQDTRRQAPLGIADTVHPARLITALLSGLLICLLEVIFVVSFAALVFSGHQASLLPQALGFMLAGNA